MLLLPNGARIVSTSNRWSADVWDAATGQDIVSLRGHESTVLSAAFSLDGGRIVTGSKDHTARIWDAATGREITFLQHAGYVESAAFSLTGPYRHCLLRLHSSAVGYDN
jgi:WD40 repeat protein